MRSRLAIVLALICAVCFSSAAASAESARRLAQMDANCQKNARDLVEIVKADRAAGRVPSYAAHPGLIDKLFVAHNDCEALVAADPTNPQYNTHAGTLEVLIGAGAPEFHTHGMAYLRNALIYASRQNDFLSLDEACSVDRAFARPDDFRCSDANYAKAESDVRHYIAELRRQEAVANAVNAARFHAMEEDYQQNMLIYHFGE